MYMENFLLLISLPAMQIDSLLGINFANAMPGEGEKNFILSLYLSMSRYRNPFEMEKYLMDDINKGRLLVKCPTNARGLSSHWMSKHFRILSECAIYLRVLKFSTKIHYSDPLQC